MKDEPIRCPRCQEERLIECVDDVIWFCNVCGKPFTIKFDASGQGK